MNLLVRRQSGKAFPSQIMYTFPLYSTIWVRSALGISYSFKVNTFRVWYYRLGLIKSFAFNKCEALVMCFLLLLLLFSSRFFLFFSFPFRRSCFEWVVSGGRENPTNQISQSYESAPSLPRPTHRYAERKDTAIFFGQHSGEFNTDELCLPTLFPVVINFSLDPERVERA